MFIIPPKKKKKIILICSDGGHLAQMLELKDWFVNYEYLLITEKSPSTYPLKESLNVRFLKGRSSGKKRNIWFAWTIMFNFFLTTIIICRHFPKAIITTGSHTAVPMCLLGKLLRVKIIWILSYARIRSAAFSANLVYPIADKFIIQWPGVKMYYKNSIYLGGIY